jgi:hypothetical protein
MFDAEASIKVVIFRSFLLIQNILAKVDDRLEKFGASIIDAATLGLATLSITINNASLSIMPFRTKVLTKTTLSITIKNHILSITTVYVQ